MKVDPDLGQIRVSRLVGAFAAGRVINPRLVQSQYYGGMIWGLSFALHERAEMDPRTGRFLNDNLAEYHVPVNADIGAIDVGFCNENDTRFNPVGARGIGEIGITGIPAAIANAVYHATGKRVRDLPILLDDLI